MLNASPFQGKVRLDISGDTGIPTVVYMSPVEASAFARQIEQAARMADGASKMPARVQHHEVAPELANNLARSYEELD